MGSKTFIGDIPEIVENILNNLNNEVYSLYSCTLVSRHWCKMSIPILWQDPFSFVRTPSFISRYFSSLGEDEKLSLITIGINVEFSKTLFEYARFLKVFDLSRLEFKVGKWINFQLENSRNHIINCIINLLFIESGVTLHKLGLCFSRSIALKPEIIYTLRFSQIQHLSLGNISENNVESTITLLRAVAKYTTKIKTLKIDDFNSEHKPRIFKALIYVIKSQKQLRLFGLFGYDYPTEFYGIISALNFHKNTLQEVMMVDCDYSEEIEVLKNCTNLETLRIRYCNYMIPLKILENNKISTFDMVECQIDAQELALILEKSGGLLQRLKFESEDEEFQKEPLLIKSFCSNITYLSIQCFGFSTQLVELIGSLQKLQFLSLWCDVDNMPKEVLNIRIMQFSEILPLTLQYFDLGNICLEPYVDVLLKHCNAPLKKILFYRLNKKISKALIKYYKRNKTLNYVGVYRYLDLDYNTRKEMEAYVELVPDKHIVVNM